MRSTASITAATVVWIGACVGCSPSLDNRERALVDQWLLCYECIDGELDSVVALAIRKPNATRNRLVSDVLLGPGATRRANIRAQLDASYARLERAAPGRLRVTRAAYIAHYESNYVATYRIRASVALAIVGASDSTAYRALDSAAVDTMARGDVRDAVRFARDSIWRP